MPAYGRDNIYKIFNDVRINQSDMNERPMKVESTVKKHV